MNRRSFFKWLGLGAASVAVVKVEQTVQAMPTLPEKAKLPTIGGIYDREGRFIGFPYSNSVVDRAYKWERK